MAHNREYVYSRRRNRFRGYWGGTMKPGSKTKPALSAREERFVSAFLESLCLAEAARAAGYADTTAAKEATKIMRRPHVAAAIRERARRFTADADAKAAAVIKRLVQIAFADIGHYVQIVHGRVVVLDTAILNEDQRAAVASIEETRDGIRVKMHDKLEALEKLGRYLALFTERHEITGADGGPLVVVQPPPERKPA